MNPNPDPLSNPDDFAPSFTAAATQPANKPANLDVNIDTPGTLLQLPTPGKNLDTSELKELVDKVVKFLTVFPEYFNDLSGEYGKPLTTVGLVLLAGIGVAVADGVLARLNSIPLFAPTFELIGLGFSGWFVVRYLLYAETRQELLTEYDQVKARIVGGKED